MWNAIDGLVKCRYATILPVSGLFCACFARGLYRRFQWSPTTVDRAEIVCMVRSYLYGSGRLGVCIYMVVVVSTVPCGSVTHSAIRSFHTTNIKVSSKKKLRFRCNILLVK